MYFNTGSAMLPVYYSVHAITTSGNANADRVGGIPGVVTLFPACRPYHLPHFAMNGANLILATTAMPRVSPQCLVNQPKQAVLLAYACGHMKNIATFPALLCNITFFLAPMTVCYAIRRRII